VAYGNFPNGDLAEFSVMSFSAIIYLW